MDSHDKVSLKDYNPASGPGCVAAVLTNRNGRFPAICGKPVRYSLYSISVL